MSCRCSDIRVLNRDIRRLRQAADCLSRLPSVTDSLSETAHRLATSISRSLDTQTSNELYGGAGRVGSVTLTAFTDAKQLIDGQIQSCEQTLSSMEREDESYHDDDDDD